MDEKIEPGMTVIHTMRNVGGTVRHAEAIVLWVKDKSAKIRFKDRPIEKACALSTLRKKE